MLNSWNLRIARKLGCFEDKGIYIPPGTAWLVLWWFLTSIMVILMLMSPWGTVAQRKATVDRYSNDQIANAIRMAEGTWTYGIKTVSCKTEEECRATCIRTIKKNKERFITYGYQEYSDFISFLGSRYCPVYQGNNTQGHAAWLKNVRYFLKKESQLW